tara:strand:+ start:191 stop:952 length:762 start_codon:yes stop_codon:yes gene_type:complete
MKQIYFIHVGKCAGSSIWSHIEFLKTTYCHMERDHNKNQVKNKDLIIICIRDPLKRFVSAFNYSYDIINYDVSNLNINSNLKNTIAPDLLKEKIKNGGKNIFDQDYIDLVNYFKTPNFLAESLTSNNQNIKKKAEKLIKHDEEHIYKGLGFYTHNGEIIDKYHKKIHIVSVDYFDRDMENLYKKIYDNKKYPGQLKGSWTRKNNNPNIYLSPLAKKNLYNFYKDTDYLALKKLINYNLITKDLYNKYLSNIQK